MVVDDYLVCEDCRVAQSKNGGFRESQWENPRPICNSCATKRAWSLFAADIAACPNAHVIHNHGTHEPPTPANIKKESLMAKENAPTQWEKDAAKRMKQQLDQDVVEEIQESNQYHLMWCYGCKKGVLNAKRCSQCQLVYFCSVACQKKAWPSHKENCYRSEVDPDIARIWSPILASTESSNPDESWDAFAKLQEWISSNEESNTSARHFRNLNGVSHFLKLLDSDKIDLEIKWQVLLLLTRLVEISTNIATDVHHLGGIPILLTLVNESMDFRIQASAVITLGTLLASNVSSLTGYFLDLNAIEVFLNVLHQASSLDGEVALVACVQTTALILQLLENNQDALSCLVKYDDNMAIAPLLTKLLGQFDKIYRLNQETGVPVGHHLYLNVLSLVGALVHAHPESKEAFVDAGILPLLSNVVKSYCLRSTFAGFAASSWWSYLWGWFISFVQLYIYDWQVTLTSTEILDILDRVMPIVTPFLSKEEWCQTITTDFDGVSLSVNVFNYLLETSSELAIRTRLSALDFFVCIILPPFEMSEDIRCKRIHENIDQILSMLHKALQFATTLTIPVTESAAMNAHETLNGMLLSEIVKCTGLVAHFGRSMPAPSTFNIPADLAKVILHDTAPNELKWIAIAALIQWDTNGNRVDFIEIDVTMLRQTVQKLFDSKSAGSSSYEDLITRMEIILNR